MLGAANPACMYLTHYSRLPFESHQVELLQSQLSQYDQIGKTVGSDQQALRSALIECTRAHLLAFLDGAGADALLERLALDINLNAQGIAFRADKIGRETEQAVRTNK